MVEHRYRTRGELSAAASHREENIWTSCTNSTWVYNGTSQIGIKLGKVSRMWDIVVPNFHRRVANGEVIMNDMMQTHEEYVTGGGIGGMYRSGSYGCSSQSKYAEYRTETDQFQYYAQRSRVSSPTGNLPVVSVLNETDAAALERQVATALASQRGRPSANMWETAAELDKTLGMIRQVADNGRKVMSRIPPRALHGAANAWLLYRYGMRPIVKDLANLADKALVQTRRIRQTTRSFENMSNMDTKSVLVAGTAANRTVNYYDSAELHLRAMSLDEFVTSQYFESGFSLKGLLTLPWELTPYSFVVDWFFNIGDLIGSIVPTPGFHQLGSCLVSERIVSSTYWAGGMTANSPWVVTRPITGSCKGTITTIKRVPIPRVGFVVKSDFRFQNLTRALDGISLLTQKLVSGGRGYR